MSTTLGIDPAVEPVLREGRLLDTGIWAVVMAGGIGSRFWPLSSPQRPKPLLTLVSERPLVSEAVARLEPLVPPERVLVATSADIAGGIREALPNVPEANILVEPRPLGTAAALAWAARQVEVRAGPHCVLCAIHADIATAFPELFRQLLARAARVAADGQAVAIAVRPTRAEPAFGYIVPEPDREGSPSLQEGGVRQVLRYVEKPDLEMANQLLDRGAFWYSGILMASVGTLRDALRRCTVELAPGAEALDALDFASFADAVGSISIERGLLERYDRLLTMLGDFGWDDVGTWASLRRSRELDDAGNGAVGPVQFVDSSTNIVHTESGSVVLYGVDQLLTVCVPGLVFVTTLDRAADLKPLLDALPADLRSGPAPATGT